ncbi:phage terminase large subunit [uncultured Alistipes sp.]|uniref:phage terminase large subunit n=1 Tax=uncultured Alistipes sp. TaxID=538949 RepID=UPI0025964E1C|nr:phage terminase large subunit [uncultured Alistipes sp.]
MGNESGEIRALRSGAYQSFPFYVALLKGKDFLTPFHLSFYWVLDAFAHGRIKRLIVTMPPQHGKSEGTTRLLPAYMLGLDPDLRIAIASYSDTFARKFNRAIQRIIDSPEYYVLFPETLLNGNPNCEDSAQYVRNNTEFEIVGRKGFLKAVGRNGALTGERIDVFIGDDLYKNAAEGYSPIIRESVSEWYKSTVKTRLHNNSRELMVFTRWHEEDLIGTIIAAGNIRELRSLDDIDPEFDGWYYLNFEAIKESDPTPIDPRQRGEALWPEAHDLKHLQEKRDLDRIVFECMYQGHPMSKEGLLYGENFKTYSELPAQGDILDYANYTDTADTGDDYLCSISYVRARDGYCYVTDMVYTQEPMECTESAVADMLKRSGTRRASIESNNGGRGFARAVQRRVPAIRIEWFHQSGNKEARILSNAATALQTIIMPHDWKIRWPEFYLHMTTYRRQFRANRWHDAADVVTGIVEDGTNKKGRIKAVR